MRRRGVTVEYGYRAEATDGDGIFVGVNLGGASYTASTLSRLRFGAPIVLAKTDDVLATGARLGGITEFAVGPRHVAFTASLRGTAPGAAGIGIVRSR